MNTNEEIEIVRYEVYDKRDRWMGGYSTKLDAMYDTDSYNMAKINASQCEGKIYKIDQYGIKKEVK